MNVSMNLSLNNTQNAFAYKSNKDLRKAIAAKEFREDLYFRISTFKLRVPPLRERPGDILPLVGQLLELIH